MKVIHRQNTDVRTHYTVNKTSTGFSNARILYAGELKKTSHWKEQLHSHSFCEIVFVKSGSGLLHTKSKDISVTKGDLLIYNPETIHSESCSENEELELYFCGIDCLHLKNKSENTLLGENDCPVFHTGLLEQDFEKYFSDLIREVQNKSYYYDEISRALVKIILNLILRLLAMNDQENFKTNECYRFARKFIDENYTKIESIEEICKNLFVSRYYLTHLFKEYSGMSPIQYIIAKRMEKAKNLLATTSLPIQEISLQSGYEEVSSFLKTFKKLENMTPSEYRKQQNLQKNS